MADRKQTNKYYPPDWDPSKGSINQYVGQHPLRERARKLDQGILIIRFEMPFNIWCLHCNNHIGMGVRYNAEKKKVGKYYSTPIWSFRMKCHLCSGWIEIHTDPKNAEYKIINGARRREESFDPADAGVISLSNETGDLTESSAFSKLEHNVKDEMKATEANPFLTRLQDYNDKHWKDPYTASQLVRKRFREEKKQAIAIKNECRELQKKMGLAINVLPPSTEDETKTNSVNWEARGIESNAEKKTRIQRDNVFKSFNRSSAKKMTAKTILAQNVLLKRHIDPFAINHAESVLPAVTKPSKPPTSSSINVLDSLNVIKLESQKKIPNNGLVDYGSSDSDDNN